MNQFYLKQSYLSVMSSAHPLKNPGERVKNKTRANKNKIAILFSCAVIGPSSLYRASITVRATFSPSFPICELFASILFGLKMK